MVVFFIRELLTLIYVILMIWSPKLNDHVYLFFNHSLSLHRNAAIMGLVCHLLAGEDCGTYRFTAHSFVVIRFFVGLIVFIPGTQLNIYVISEHWIDLSTAGWLLLQIFGMSSQLIWFCRERLLGGVPYWKICSVVYVLDLYRIYMCMKFITVKKVKSSFSLYNGAYIWEWKYV